MNLRPRQIALTFPQLMACVCALSSVRASEPLFPEVRVTNAAVVPVLRYLHEQVVNNAAMHVGDSEVATVVSIRELLVVEAEEVEDRGVKIMVRDRGLHRMHAKVVGGAISEAAFDSAAGHPH